MNIRSRPHMVHGSVYNDFSGEKLPVDDQDTLCPTKKQITFVPFTQESYQRLLEREASDKAKDKERSARYS